MLTTRVSVLAGTPLLLGVLLPQDMSSDIRESILNRSRTQIGVFDAPTVKLCPDEGFSAESASRGK